MIYFIRRPDDGAIKIGTTIRLSDRLRQLCKEHVEGLEVLAITDGDRVREQALHLRFGHLRVLNEWFEPGDDLVGFIVTDARPWDGSDDAPRVYSPVRLDLAEDDHERLERCAKRLGLSKSSYVRLALFERMKADEEKEG